MDGRKQSAGRGGIEQKRATGTRVLGGGGVADRSDKEQVSPNAASQNDVADAAIAAVGGRKRMQRPTVRTAKPTLRPAMERKWTT